MSEALAEEKEINFNKLFKALIRRKRIIIFSASLFLASSLIYSSIKRIISKFKSIGYDVKMQMLDANDFDVPQNRKRVFIVGFRSDLKVNFHFPQPQIFLQKKKLPLNQHS